VESSDSEFEPGPGKVTALLEAIRDGDEDAEKRLLELVYLRLQEIAERMSGSLKMPTSLSPGSVCHDTIVKFIEKEVLGDFGERKHFYSVFAQAVKHEIFDYARRKKSLKRGGGLVRVDFELALQNFSTNQVDLFEFYDALDELAKADPEVAKVAELRFFAGLELTEVADALGVSVSTVESRQKVSRAFLITILRPRD